MPAPRVYSPTYGDLSGVGMREPRPFVLPPSRKSLLLVPPTLLNQSNSFWKNWVDVASTIGSPP
jgi:hypothetical protein